MPDQVTKEIQQANKFGDEIENLVLAKGQAPTGDRKTLLMAYWSLALAFDFHRGILALIDHRFYGSSFALVRPIIETTVRAHVALFCTDEVLKTLHNDTYHTNFATVGKEIDTAFGLNGFFEKFLNRARAALHTYTHAGLLQLGRRFKGADLVAHYDEAEILEVIRSSTSCVFMVNNLVTKHFGFEDEWKQNNALFGVWGKHG